MGKTYDHIANECEKLGISVGELSRKADIDRSVLHAWKIKEPKTLQTWRRIKSVLKHLKAAKIEPDKPTRPTDGDEPMQDFTGS